MISENRTTVVAERPGDETFLPQIPETGTHGPSFGLVATLYGWWSEEDVQWPAWPQMTGTQPDGGAWTGGSLLGHAVESVALFEYRNSSTNEWVRDLFYIKFDGGLGPGEDVVNVYPGIRFESNGNYVDFFARSPGDSDYVFDNGVGAWRIIANQVEQVKLKAMMADAVANNREVTISVIGENHTSGSVIPGETLDRIEDGGESRVDYHGYFNTMPYYPSADLTPIGALSDGGLLGWSVDTFGIVDFERSNGSGGWIPATARVLFRLTPPEGVLASEEIEYDSITITHGTNTVTIPREEVYWAVNESTNKAALVWTSPVLESWIAGGLGSTPLTYQFNGVPQQRRNAKLHIRTADGWKDMSAGDGIRRGWVRTLDPEEGEVWSPMQLTVGICDDVGYYDDPQNNDYSGIFSEADGRVFTEMARQHPDNANWTILNVPGTIPKIVMNSGSAPAMDGTDRRFSGKIEYSRFKVARYPLGSVAPNHIDVQKDGGINIGAAPFQDVQDGVDATMGTVAASDGTYLSSGLANWLTIEDENHPIHNFKPSSWTKPNDETVWMPNVFSPCFFTLEGNQPVFLDSYSFVAEVGYAILYPYATTGNEDVRMSLVPVTAYDEKYNYKSSHRGVLVRFVRSSNSVFSSITPIANVPNGALEGSLEGMTVTPLTGNRDVVCLSITQRYDNTSFTDTDFHIRRRSHFYMLGVNRGTSAVTSTGYYPGWTTTAWSNLDWYSIAGVLNGAVAVTHEDGSESVIASYVQQFYGYSNATSSRHLQTLHRFLIMKKNTDGTFDTMQQSSETRVLPNEFEIVSHGGVPTSASAYPEADAQYPEQKSPRMLGLIAQFSLFRDTGSKNGEALGLTRAPYLPGKKAEYRAVKIKFHLERNLDPDEDVFTIEENGTNITIGAVRFEMFDDDSLDSAKHRPGTVLAANPAIAPVSEEYGYLQRIRPAIVDCFEDQQASFNQYSLDLTAWASVLPGELSNLHLHPTQVTTASGPEWIISATGLRIIDRNQPVFDPSTATLNKVAYYPTADNQLYHDPFRCPNISLFPVYPGKFKDIDGDVETLSEVTLSISQSSNNLNLRAVYDSIYSAENDVVTFDIADGLEFGSSSTSLFSFDTGDWPANTSLRIRFLGQAYVVGAGGKGGNGNGQNGGNGGPAMKVRKNVIVEATSAVVIGGGGGGGAGGNVNGSGNAGGGGGGGGAGKVPGARGTRTTGSLNNGSNGNAGTLTSGGSGGAGGDNPFGTNGTSGGNGGDLGENGQNRSGASGGQSGAAIDGASLVAWTGTADVRGPQTN